MCIYVYMYIYIYIYVYMYREREIHIYIYIKVIQLMEGMATKGKEEKHAEQVQFAAYKQFCDDTTTEKSRAIKEAEEKIEVLTADIEGFTEHAAQMTKESGSSERHAKGARPPRRHKYISVFFGPLSQSGS